MIPVRGKKEMKEHYDVIIVGTGAAGLYCALNLPEKMKILLITKQEADQSDSFLAQGGICMLRGEDDYENYFEDTMRAGHRFNVTVSGAGDAHAYRAHGRVRHHRRQATRIDRIIVAGECRHDRERPNRRVKILVTLGRHRAR